MTDKQFSAILEQMEQLNHQVPDKVSPLQFSNKHILLFLLLVSILCGISGYLIVVRKGKNIKSQLASQPIPIISLTRASVPRVPTVSLCPTSTLNPARADWLTYTNATFGATFQYPSDWQLGDIRRDPTNPKNEELLFGDVHIYVEDNPNNLDYAFMKDLIYTKFLILMTI